MQALQFSPLSDDEIYNVWPEGEYEGRTAASMHTSQSSGKSSIKLQIKIGESDKMVFAYLTPAYAKLLKHFCKAAGIMEEYDAGNVTPQACNNKVVKFYLGVEDDPKYGRKNVLVDFLFNKDEPQSLTFNHKGKAVGFTTLEAPADFDDKDVPF